MHSFLRASCRAPEDATSPSLLQGFMWMVWWREATQQNTGSRRSLTSRVHSPDFSLLRRQEILLFSRDSFIGPVNFDVKLIKVARKGGVELVCPCTILYDLMAQGIKVLLRIIIDCLDDLINFLRIKLCRTSRINLFVTFPNLKTSKTPERAYNFNSLEMKKWQSTPEMLSRVSPMHLLLVSNCAWMFQDHSFKKALENGGVAFPECVSPKAIPKFADEIYILNFVFESCDILSKALRCYIGDRRAFHMARATSEIAQEIAQGLRRDAFLETEVDSNHSNRVRMKCTMSNMHMISLSLSLSQYTFPLLGIDGCLWKK